MSYYLGWKGKFHNDKQIHEEEIKILNTYGFNNRTSKYMIKFKGKIYKSIIVDEDFNTTLLETEVQIILRNC